MEPQLARDVDNAARAGDGQGHHPHFFPHTKRPNNPLNDRIIRKPLSSWM